MKIKVSDLEANPYRNIAKYPIDRSKVDALKTSIKETTFWDNILVRAHPTKKGKYQIAYGHHRHIALKELKLQEVDIPCRTLTDAQMLKIMAEENLEWSTSPAVINETVLATKKFLDVELAKYKTLAELKLADKSIGQLFKNQQSFANAKREDTSKVGRETILKFLGANWKEWLVQGALDTLNADKLPIQEGGVDRKAVETLPTMEAANRFRVEIKKHNIPKLVQRRIAKTIVSEKIGTKHIPETIREIAKPEHLDVAKKKTVPTLDKFVDDTITNMQSLRLKLSRVRSNIKDIQSARIHGQFLMECGNLTKMLNNILKEKENAKKTRK